MLQRIAAGSAAGAAATLPMSGVVWGARTIGVYRRKPPPEQVAEESTRPLFEPKRLPGPARAALKTGQHFGFGGAVGGVFGLASFAVKPSALTGLLTGLGVWAASYGHVIPAVGVMPPPGRDEHGRAATMVVAHVVYGLALGLGLRWWLERRRTA
jgi:hypothetical protein